MVWMNRGRRALRGGAGRIAAGAAILAAFAGIAAIAAVQGAGLALFGLHAVALAGVTAAWVQVRSARRTAEKASSDLDTIAKRLIQLEHRLLQSGAGAPDPALRSTVAEVTGEIGVLGGIIRDLAETVAAQDRDVADLKERIQPPAPEAAAAPLASRPGSGEPRRAPAPEPVVHPEPSLLPAGRKAPLLSDAETRRIAAIVHAFEADRVEMHLQPIVALPQRKVRFYEALARLRLADETVLVPAEFLPVLERLGHAGEFDRRVVGRALAIARHLMARGSEAIVSVNLSPRSLEEPGFLRSVGRIMDAFPDTLGRVVLELSQRCWRTLDAERAGALAALRDKGVPFALDRASDLRLDPLALADRGVRFVKLPADLLIAADHSRGLDIELGDLASVLRRAGIKLVAERVEREETVPDLIDLDVPLAQGFVFAAPRAVRSEVLSPPAANEAPALAAEPQTAPDQASVQASVQASPQAAEPPSVPTAEERLPFRSFLRRAS
jgi:cyclic-di-GMP phosphodiesterase TipF (flagellum assembly factor)